MSDSGTGRSDAFATWIDSRADIEGLSWLIAHEYMHTWVPRQLGELPPRDEEQAYWFSEGFTDYLTRRVMLEAGLWTPDRFARDWNEMLRACATSTFRLTPNAEAARVQWTGGIDAEKLPYQRGAMLAAIWHHQLAQRGSGLDQMLRSMRDDIARSARRPPDAASGFRMAARRTGFDVETAIARHLDRGEAIVLPADVFGPCFRVIQTESSRFDRGYDAAATSRAGRVVGVDQRSNAYAAGLRDGMTVVRRVAGEYGNPDVDYTLEVRAADGANRRITYRPASRERFELQRVALRIAASRDHFRPASAFRAASLRGLPLHTRWFRAIPPPIAAARRNSADGANGRGSRPTRRLRGPR